MSGDPSTSKRVRSPLAMTVLAGAASVIGGALSTAPALAAPPAKTAVSECSAANQKSIKLRTAHKLRAALEQATECAAVSCKGAVKAACTKRVVALNKAIPTIIFVAKDKNDESHELTDVKVSMDGEPLTDHLDGTALSVDPGQHTFTFEVTGQPSVDQSFLITEGQKDRRETVTLAAPPPPPPPAVAVETPSPTDASASGSSRPLRTVGLVAGGVGVAGLVAGGVVGGLALGKWHTSESECESATQCSNHAQSVSDHSSATSLATVSTALLIVGGVALATGVTLFFVAPKKEGAAAPPPSAFFEVSPILAPGNAGMMVKGVF